MTKWSDAGPIWWGILVTDCRCRVHRLGVEFDPRTSTSARAIRQGAEIAIHEIHQDFRMLMVEGVLHVLHPIANDPDVANLVLMGFQVPVMDGFETTRQRRPWEAVQWCPWHPVVSLAAEVFAETRQKALDTGMDNFAPKSIQAKRLCDTMQAWTQPGVHTEKRHRAA